MDDIIVINFISGNQQIMNFGVPCTKDNTFAEIEEKLYQNFPKFRDSNNLCMSGGQVILRFKTIGENNLKNGTVVTIDSHDE